MKYPNFDSNKEDLKNIFTREMTVLKEWTSCIFDTVSKLNQTLDLEPKGKIQLTFSQEKLDKTGRAIPFVKNSQ